MDSWRFSVPKALLLLVVVLALIIAFATRLPMTANSHQQAMRAESSLSAPSYILPTKEVKESR